MLQELRDISSTLAKQALLRKASEEEKKIFQYAYNPHWMYYLKFDRIDYNSYSNYNEDMFTILDSLINGSLRGNLARDRVEKYSQQHGDLIKLICNKDLDCGVSSTTLNKVFGKNFIPQFKVQLAKEVAIKDIQMPCQAEIKYNGVRVIALLDNGTIQLKTRNGKIFEYPMLEKELSWIAGTLILDGELCFGDSKNTNHTGVSGLVNSAIRGNPIIGTPLNFRVFDTMPLKDFQASKCDIPFWKRREILNEICPLDNSLITPSYGMEITSHKELQEYFDKVLKQGYEGLIVKPYKHLYTFKRSKDWIKLKAIKDCDLKCTDIKYGTGKYEGQIGSLICEGTVEGLNVTVDVGTGLSDMQRRKPICEYLNKTIEIKYNEVIQDSKTGKWSLFLPRFIQIREDK